MAADINDPVLLQLGYISLLLQRLIDTLSGQMDNITYNQPTIDDVTSTLVSIQRSLR